jgi:hypothetical protein
MKFIDNFDIKGIDKKNIIISTIKKFLLDENCSNIDYIIDNICPNLIDILVSVDKRKVVIKKKSKCLVS